MSTGDLDCFWGLFASYSNKQFGICFADYFWRHSEATIVSYVQSKSEAVWVILDYKISQVGQPFPYMSSDFSNLAMTMIRNGYLSISGLTGTPYANNVLN